MSKSKIEAAVAPLKEMAIAATAEFAEKQVAKIAAELAAAGWNLNEVVPQAKTWGMSRREYFEVKAKRSLYLSVVKTVEISQGWNEKASCIVEMCPEYVSKFIEGAKRAAAEEYEAYVAKMVAKVGEVESAELSAKAVWSLSYLTVIKANGEKEVWKTRMILNVSKLGKIFNQWPTRKMK